MRQEPLPRCNIEDDMQDRIVEVRHASAITAARVFVGIVFTLLGLSFVASTAVILYDFRGDEPMAMLMTHSHLFFFFPTFGILALGAFYLPSVIFTDFYWHHVGRFGPLRFFVGFLAVTAAAAGAATWLQSQSMRGLWELSPDVHASAARFGNLCGGQPCRQSPTLSVLRSLRDVSRSRVGFGKYSRNCTDDTRLERPDDFKHKRFCFADPDAGNMDRDQCCRTQEAFEAAVARVYQDPASRSLAGRTEPVFQIVKSFFVGVVLIIGALLVFWHAQIQSYYREHIPRMERGVLIGAVAMLMWPVMDYGYLEATHLMYGRRHDLSALRLSLLIAPWALLLLLYFMKRLGPDIARYGQPASVAASVGAIFLRDDLNDWALRLVGAGAQAATIALMLALVVAGFVALRWPIGADQAARADKQL